MFLVAYSLLLWSKLYLEIVQVIFYFAAVWLRAFQAFMVDMCHVYVFVCIWLCFCLYVFGSEFVRVLIFAVCRKATFVQWDMCEMRVCIACGRECVRNMFATTSRRDITDELSFQSGLWRILVK